MTRLNIMMVGVLVVSVVIHELAHGWVAWWCGDWTAKRKGRLSMNPLRHLDPLGSVLLPLMLVVTGSPVLFGWAKPVPVSMAALNDPRNDMVKVAVAGPLSNITIAWLVAKAVPFIGDTPWLGSIMSYAIGINVVLAVFNMIPIPPMDGSRIVYRWLPPTGCLIMDRMEPYGLWIILILATAGLFDRVIMAIAMPIMRFII